MTPFDLAVQDVEDGATVRGPDPERIVFQYKTISHDADGKVVEEIVRNEWVLHTDVLPVEEEPHGALNIDAKQLAEFTFEIDISSKPIVIKDAQTIVMNVDARVGQP